VGLWSFAVSLGTLVLGYDDLAVGDVLSQRNLRISCLAAMRVRVGCWSRLDETTLALDSLENRRYSTF
jgi:hypothetical protein